MECVHRLNQSMNYIEEHLTGEIDYEKLGRIACCSTYYYQRMFSYMACITLAEYIRRRKMSLAAVKFRIIGVSAPLDKEIENNFMVVPKMWQKASLNGTIQKLAGMTDTPLRGLLSVNACNDEEQRYGYP